MPYRIIIDKYTIEKEEKKIMKADHAKHQTLIQQSINS